MKKTNLFLFVLFILLGAQHQTQAAQDLNELSLSFLRSISLVRAARKGEFGTVNSLVDQGANVNFQDETGKTALFYFARCYNNQILQDFLKAPDLKINHVDKQGKTALFYAVEFGSPENVQALLSKGANVHFVSHGKTVLDIARQPTHAYLVSILRNAGALTFQEIKALVSDTLG